MQDLSGRPPSHPLIRQPLMTVTSVVRRIGNITVQAMTTGWIAFMTQPAPFTSLALAVVIELGDSLLRLLSPRVRIIALALAICSIATGLALHLAG